MLKQYLVLKWKSIYRSLAAEGFNPYLFLALAIPFFLGNIYMILEKWPVTSYLLIAVAAFGGVRLISVAEFLFLQSLYPLKKLRLGLLLLRFLVLLPFVLLLLFRQQYLQILLLSLTPWLYILYDRQAFSYQIRIPLPFSESNLLARAGFRQVGILVFLLLALTVIGLCVQNYQLASAGLLGILLVYAFCYARQQPAFYIWMHSKKSLSFLFFEYKQAFLQAAAIVLPLMIVLLGLLQTGFLAVCALLFGLAIILLAFLIGKYSVYPQVISAIILQNVLLLFAVMMLLYPPALILVIPLFAFFTYKSCVKLKTYLC